MTVTVTQLKGFTSSSDSYSHTDTVLKSQSIEDTFIEVDVEV